MRKNWLIELRKSRNMTQEEVAFAAFINRGYYSQVETGKRTPSLNVAINIARVLKFDPMMFYRDHLLDFSENGFNLKNNIPETFRSMIDGQILYLYSNPDKFVEHVVTFLVTAGEKDSHCLLIDDYKNYCKVRQKLQASHNHRDINTHLWSVNIGDLKHMDPKQIEQRILDYQIHFTEIKTIRIWINEETVDKVDWLYNFETYLRTKSRNWTKPKVKLLFIRSYNANRISADLSIKMMRMYSHLMTDVEIVHSPIYKNDNKSFLFSPLSTQQ
ncbi:helix-turn-helix domain-containing protein [Evansella tamaricis]|uniref:helix-turn-helix domain-containing protein n=1 Tax=Evansella tamaricis TaxID=2069301 RepID=UPI001FE25C01|nr:helix-turn-helix transcriptional regulator [Evansella tamaricis]